MNSAKKALKNQDKPVRLGSTGEKKNPIVLVIIIAIVSIVLIAGVAYENLRPQNAVTIDGKKISVTKMMYNIWNVEMQYSYYDSMYQAMYNTSYWNMTADSETGATYAQQAKDEVMNIEVQSTLLYKEALDKGYSLTDEESKEVEEDVEGIAKHYTFWNRMRLGFTKSYLKKQLTRAKIVSRYRDDLIEGFDIDDEGITAEFNKDEYKEYNISYYYASITETDEDGNEEDLSKKEVNAIKDEMQELRDTADEAEDFSKLLDGDEETDEDAQDSEEESKAAYGTDSFIEKDGWRYASDKNCDIIKSLKVDAVSDVIVDEESGYIYFVRLDDNTSTETYDNEVEDAITNAEEEEFTKYYDELYKKHKVSINEKVWETVVMGEMTTGIEYIADTEENTSEDSDASEDESAEDGEESSDDGEASDEEGASEENGNSEEEDGTETE